MEEHFSYSLELKENDGKVLLLLTISGFPLGLKIDLQVLKKWKAVVIGNKSGVSIP